MRQVDAIDFALRAGAPPANPADAAPHAHLAWAVARIKRLEKALKTAKRKHIEDAYLWGAARPTRNVCCPAVFKDQCECGANGHNAAIDAALNEDA